MEMKSKVDNHHSKVDHDPTLFLIPHQVFFSLCSFTLNVKDHPLKSLNLFNSNTIKVTN